MSLFSLAAWLKSIVLRLATRGQHRNSGRRPSLQVENLEDRYAPAVLDLNTGLSFGTIQAAVNAANPHDILVADPGMYHENVTINRPLTLEGARHGVDARTRSGAESIVDGWGAAPFYVTANDVTIDGFTIQEAQDPTVFPGGFGIEMAAGISGAHILNNVIQDNIAGIALVNQSAADPAVIQFNLFKNNTSPGSAGGTDIYADQFTAGAGGVNNVLIDSNTFTNDAFTDNAWALDLSNTGTIPFTQITFSNNTVTNHGHGVQFYDTTSSSITGNTITGVSHFAIGLFGNNGTPANSLFTISNNTLNAAGRGGAGVDLANDTSASAYSGTLTLSGFGLLMVDVQQKIVMVGPGVIAYGDTEVDYRGVSQVNLDNTVTVNALAGPDTADRATALAGLTANERFVQALYLDDLGRAGSKTELDNWLPALSAGGRQAVAGAIARSFEAQDHLVKSWYVQFLGRQATGGEENLFVNQLLPVVAGGRGMTEELVLCQILSSPEFYNRAQTLVSAPTADQSYVQALYLVLLHRTASAAEVAGWTTVMWQGGRQAVAMGFLQSPEFRTYQLEGYYDALLRRPGDSGGLHNWVMSSLDLSTVCIDFESSSEFFNNG
jgi:hypothetical protein